MKKEMPFQKIKLQDALHHLHPVLRPYLPKFGVGLIIIFLSTGIEVFLPILLGWGVDAAISPGKDFSLVLKLAITFGLLVLLKAILETGQAYLIQATGQAVTHDLRSMIFLKMERLSVTYFDKNPTGRLLTRIINDVKSLSELFTASFSVLLLDLMIILGSVVAMLWVHTQLALVILVTFPVIVLTIRYFGTRVAIVYRAVRARLAEINAFLGENLGAISTIQRLSAEQARLARFEQLVLHHQDAQMDTLRLFALVQPFANTLNGIAMATLVGVGGTWVIEGRLTLGIFVAFLGYIRNLFQPIRDLIEKYNTLLSAMVSAERIVAILQEREETDKSQIQNTSSPLISNNPPHNRKDVCFKDVSFRYPTREKYALEEISLNVEHAMSVAIVGATGSGKSTLIRLLLRFYEPQKGSISFCGKPIADWPLAHLRSQIGVVHQDIYLFSGSLRENLTLGRENCSYENLVEHCRKAQLWNFVENRGGLEMKIFEGGSNLSLGEKQLISFARILVHDPEVLILDEATASIDRVLERRLIEAIEEVMATRTSIIVAHRLSTIRRCHKIVVLEGGRVVEEGDHKSLLDRKGHFKAFHDIHLMG